MRCIAVLIASLFVCFGTKFVAEVTPTISGGPASRFDGSCDHRAQFAGAMAAMAHPGPIHGPSHGESPKIRVQGAKTTGTVAHDLGDFQR